MRDFFSTVYKMNKSVILSSLTYVIYFFFYVLSDIIMLLMYYLGNHALDFINCNDELVVFINYVCSLMGAFVAIVISIFTTIQLIQKVTKDMIKLINEFKKDLLRLKKKDLYSCDPELLDKMHKDITEDMKKKFDEIEFNFHDVDAEEKE